MACALNFLLSLGVNMRRCSYGSRDFVSRVVIDSDNSCLCRVIMASMCVFGESLLVRI